jgi:hypothetical protein
MPECDCLVKAKIPPGDIQMLSKFVEGLGHLGVITTTDRHQGEVVIQTTTDCWPDLRAALASMPFAIEIEEGQPQMPSFPTAAVNGS